MIRTRFLLTITLIAGALLILGAACDELITETIEVTIAGHPTAEFGYTPDVGCTPLVVQFTDASSGPVVKWIWDFGDGESVTLWKDSGHNGDTGHTYDSIGAYTVVLTVFDTLDGSDDESKKRAIVADHNIDAVELSDTLLCAGDSVVFTAINALGITSWRWEFGDLQISTDTGHSQSHTYANPGVYFFKLTATGACGQSVLEDTIHVLACATSLFERLDSGAGCVPFTAQFLDMSSPALSDSGEIVGAITKWEWTFGDGHRQSYTTLTDTVENEYSDAGIYEVTLTVTIDSGGTSSYVDTLVAYPAEQSDFTAAPTFGCHLPGRQFVVSFRREATGDTAWVWDFGDGDSAFTQNPYHAYTDPGEYSVSLAVYGACGADVTSTSKTDLIIFSDQIDSASTEFFIIQDSVEYQIIGVDTNVVDIDTTIDTTLDTSYWYTFDDASPAAAVVYWEWDFGDESVHSFEGPTITHEFDDTGTYFTKMSRFNTCDSIVVDSVLVIPLLNK